MIDTLILFRTISLIMIESVFLPRNHKTTFMNFSTPNGKLYKKIFLKLVLDALVTKELSYHCPFHIQEHPLFFTE